LKESIALLIEAQLLDDRLAVVNRRLDSLDVELGEAESRLAVLGAEAEDAAGERKACLARAKDIENTLLLDEAKAAKWEGESNRMRDAGAAEIARQKVQTLRDKVAGGEEEALALMENAEKLVTTIETAKSAVAQAAEEMEAFRATGREDQKSLEADKAELLAQRELALSRAAMEARAAYERLIGSRSGKPLAVIRVSSCSGCGMTVPPNEMGRALGLAGLVSCRSCSRILIPEEFWKSTSEGGIESADESANSG
tara:strand:- start:248 stop:1012 length:765 start_codon:yes stop_codon:yes gene_type:complete